MEHVKLMKPSKLFQEQYSCLQELGADVLLQFTIYTLPDFCLNPCLGVTVQLGISLEVQHPDYRTILWCVTHNHPQAEIIFTPTTQYHNCLHTKEIQFYLYEPTVIQS